MNPDTDGDGIPDNLDIIGDGLVLVTVTNQLPGYSAQVSAGTGNPEYKATVTFVPVLPSNTVRIVNAVVDGWIDDSFKINGVKYGWTWGIKPFHKNITSVLPDPINGIFDIEIYDYVDPGWFGNGVSISGTCVMVCLVGIKVELKVRTPIQNDITQQYTSGGLYIWAGGGAQENSEGILVKSDGSKIYSN